jgi:hypothetical protein
MSLSMKVFLLGIILMCGIEAPKLLREYTASDVQEGGIINYFLVFSVVFLVALKGFPYTHLFCFLISFIVPKEKHTFRIEGRAAEIIFVSVMLIIVAIIWFVISEKFCAEYPITLIKVLLLSVIISVITKLQTILQTLQSKKQI